MKTFVSAVALATAVMIGAPAFAQQSPPPAEVEAGKDLTAIATLAAKDAPKLTVTTPGWKNGADIDFKFTQYKENEFPGLEWTKGPATTKSYAIVMQDTDFVARGAPILHWTVANVPAATTKLAAGMKPEEIPKGSIYGPNYQGASKPYLGPRTPPGAKHRYHIQVLAIDTVLPADFAPKTYAEFIEPLKGHVVAAGSVMGLGQADPSAPPPAPRPNVPVPAGPASAAPATNH